MAFPAPITVQTITSTTTDLLPTMYTALKAPLKRLIRPQIAQRAAVHQSASSTQTSPGPKAHANTHNVALPDCLQSLSLAALRPGVGALKSIPTASGMLFAVPHSGLRSAKPFAQSLPFGLVANRQYSTISRMTRSYNPRPLPKVGNVGLALAQQRTIFGGPSQNVLARLELAANNNPSSPTAQAAFYSALLRANMPQIVVDRYRSGRFATGAAVDNFYHKALEKVGQSDHGAVSQGQHTQGYANLTPQQLQAVGQAVGTHSSGSQIGRVRAGSGVKNDPLYVVVEESMWSTFFKWFRWLLGFALAAYVALVLITLFVETSGVLKKVGGATSAEVRPESQSTRFTDVHGCDEAKEELKDVVDFLKNPERYNKLGGRLPKGVLLVGPPGTGKTLLARAVAGEAGVPFFYMSGSEFDEVYVGVGAKRVRELFSAARAKAPAIVFIDELDAVGGKRKSRDANYHRQTLNQLLNDLDGFDQSTGVIFIAATNHPELLDKALLRPGRFDRHIQVALPDVQGRLAILKHHTRKIRLGPNVDLTNIARGTPGFSGAELENLANTAAIRAAKNLSKYVNVDDLEWARDKIMMGAERKSHAVSLKDKLHTAYHEGGHTLVGLYTKGYNEVHKATILPRGMAAGITWFLPREEAHKSKSQYLVDLQVSLGGRLAEEIVYGPDNIGDGASSDITNATRVAYNMVTSFGFSDVLGEVDFRSNYEQVSPETKRMIDNEVRRLIDEARNHAKELLLSKREELDRLAKALVQYETLDREEILKVIKGESLPDRMVAAPDVQIKIPEPSPPSTPRIPIIPPGVGGNGEDPDPPSASGVPA
ncbi:ATP-dependent metallopeptidase Hfl [Westerdykella ornata]|uniref:ATP-dependent metallopeptidase Hfl n=1 Tax=Westerdykella ornata TaxID=318751 RepID=A0A6A6JKT2_WESOR|nr:ATP-dependent metallopeptidase Hfl [Westerdykella ornata]KAF2276723.1 ATP-dependent metallopeptidase Hfl [Westerdykella ornata]